MQFWGPRFKRDAGHFGDGAGKKDESNPGWRKYLEERDSESISCLDFLKDDWEVN